MPRMIFYNDINYDFVCEYFCKQILIGIFENTNNLQFTKSLSKLSPI